MWSKPSAGAFVCALLDIRGKGKEKVALSTRPIVIPRFYQRKSARKQPFRWNASAYRSEVAGFRGIGKFAFKESAMAKTRLP